MRPVRYFMALCGRDISQRQRANRKTRTRSIFWLFVSVFFAISSGHAQTVLDTIVFGDNTSETGHSLSNYFTVLFTNSVVSPAQTARRCTIALPTNIYGGTLTFAMAVDPLRRNYFSCRFWGGDDGSSSVNGRIYLYVPAWQYNAGATNNYQVGYRHEGDYMPLSVVGSHPPLPGRFFYSTTLLPLWMTQGRTNLFFTIVSAGRIFPLGSGDQNHGGNYQFNMSTNSRSIYRAYTHTDPWLDVSGETQGVAPVATTRPSPTSSIMNSGGTFQNGVNSYINTVLTSTLANLTTSEVEALARSYSISDLPAGYQKAAAVTRVLNAIDMFTTNYFANPSSSVSTGGGNENWGGRFGPLGHAISLLLPQLQGSLEVIKDYGSGPMTRRQAWGMMLKASRDYGRTTRDSHNISNQNLISDQNIFMANMGLLALGDTNAFSQAVAERYLREACGLSPWLGGDLANGGSSLLFGTNYFQVTLKGLTRESGYLGNAYGEVGYYAANFYQYTTNPIYLAQAVKMVKARAAFRRPTIEISGANNYRCMEGIGLLAWRGADESDGDYADAMDYGDRGQWADGMRVAGVTLDPTVVGYAKQMLVDDNQYFSQLISDPRYYSGGSLAANSFDGRTTVEAFGDYKAASAAPDSGIRLPMTAGQPDFAWADEDDGIIAAKRGNERLWLSVYWQAHQGVNGVGRFHYSTNDFERYGVLETTPQIAFSGSFYVRPNLNDWIVQTLYTPPDNPTNAYTGERLPVAMSDPLATGTGPFAGKALFWACRYGNFLIGVNRDRNKSYLLKTPPDFVSATNLINGQNVSGAVNVAPQSTVVLYLNSPVNSNPVPSTPLALSAVGDASPKVTLNWSTASGASSYLLKRALTSGGPYSVIANVAGTNYTDNGISRGAVYYYVVTGTNSFGESDYNSMEAVSSAGLPAPWIDADIGSVGLPGNASYVGGVFKITAAGPDIGGTADSFNFAYRSLTNDGAIIARLATMQPAGSSDKVAVMMRESTSAGAKAAAMMFDLTPGFHSVRFATRTSNNSFMTYNWDGPVITGAPVWFKLQRVSNTFTGFYSTDGATWIPVGTNTFTMNSILLTGVAVCSRTSSAVDTSTFDNVTLPGWPGFPATPTGLVASAGDAQVVLNWTTATNATGYNVKSSLISGGGYAPIATNIPGLTYTNTSLTNGVRYFYVVSGVNVAGESGDSREASAQPVSVSVPQLDFSLGAGSLQLLWPQDHIGWRLETETNLQEGDWTAVPEASGTNQLVVPISEGARFFRLVHP